MASPSYLVKCAFPSSVPHIGRAWEARCRAAAGAERENMTKVGRPRHKGPWTLARREPTHHSPTPAGKHGVAARPARPLPIPLPLICSPVSSLSLGLERQEREE